MAKISLPSTPDALKLANQQLQFVDNQQDIIWRGRIYPLLFVYLIVLLGLSIFVIVAIGLTASGVWAIPWATLVAAGAGDFGLGAGTYFFRAPMGQLFPQANHNNKGIGGDEGTARG